MPIPEPIIMMGCWVRLRNGLLWLSWVLFRIWPAATAPSPGNLLGIRTLRPTSRPPESEYEFQQDSLVIMPLFYHPSGAGKAGRGRGHQDTQSESGAVMVAQRKPECSYQNAEWMLGRQKQQVSTKIHNMYSVIIIHHALYYAFFRYYLVFTPSYKISSDRIP